MKWHLVLCVLVCALCSTAQPPLPFPVGDVQWTVNSVQMGESYPDRIYATMGDSTINGNLYQRIDWIANTGEPFEPDALTYFGGIRDESGQWLFVPAEDTEEVLLYDFTGAVGDTITIENPRWQNGPQEYRVQEISPTPVLSGNRRTWILFHNDGGSDEYWIEGIGSINGLFGHALQLFDAGDALICMEENGELIYRIPDAESCYYLSTGLEERAAEGTVQLAEPRPGTGHPFCGRSRHDPSRLCSERCHGPHGGADRPAAQDELPKVRRFGLACGALHRFDRSARHGSTTRAPDGGTVGHG